MFQLVHKVHRIWYWQREAKDALRSSENFHQLLLGGAVHLAFGDKWYLRIAAQLTLIIRTFQQVIAAQKTLRETYRSFSSDFSGKTTCHVGKKNVEKLAHYFAFVLPEWEARNASYYLQELCVRIERIARRFISFIAEMLELSGHIITLYEACTLGMQQEAMIGLFRNMAESIKTLTADKEILLKEIESNEVVIAQLLNQFDSNLSVKEITSHIRASLDSFQTGWTAVGQHAILLPRLVQSSFKTLFSITGLSQPLDLIGPKPVY